LISDINGVDSVTVKFLSKNNEDYHRRFVLAQRNSEQARNQNRIDSGVETLTEALPQGIPNGYQKNRVVGLDPVLGDIIFNPNEYPIIRGGWTDRNGIFYTEEPLDGFSSVNINVTGFTPRTSVNDR